ncbi:hypothetical protein [Bacteroides sp. 224]|uniref:hypothetical protein n=1 Tax=Bacteroides sp. 224 TaxID=2302936 RepID=UPI0013D1F8E4|nr:hypothetical protein [Bacteroides sp. 224]
MWFSFFIYTYHPAGFVCLNSFVYAAVLLTVVSYYRYIFQLTSSDIRQNISVWHYIIAAIVPGALFVCSFFIPFDVQEALVAGRGQLYEGYKIYSLLFLSKPILLFVYGMVYTVASIRRLFAYYTTAKSKEDVPIKLKRWVVALMAIALTILLFAVFMLLVPRSRLTSTGGFLGLVLLSCCQHIVLGYNAICRNFLIYMVKEEAGEATPDIPEQAEKPELKKREYKRTSEVTLSPQGKLVSTPITKKHFEAYMRNNKPYLNPKMKITDLIEPLKANRTAISNFVNTTYGINFNCYINQLRLKEVRRLQKLPSNVNTDLAKLVKIAGFTDVRHYHRASTPITHTEE